MLDHDEIERVILLCKKHGIKKLSLCEGGAEMDLELDGAFGLNPFPPSLPAEPWPNDGMGEAPVPDHPSNKGK